MRSPRSLMRRLAPVLYVALIVVAAVAIERYLGFDEPIRSVAGEPVVVRDGDTMTIGKTDVRLFGIDAPELSQTCREADGGSWKCGQAARARLRSLIARGKVECSPRARDRFGRAIAVCAAEGSPDIGAALVREGLAVNSGGLGDGPYGDGEAEARAQKRGIWRGPFEPPAEWRDAHPRAED